MFDGGANSTGTVVELDTSGTAPTVLYTFSGLGSIGGANNDGAFPSDLIQGSDGVFYGITTDGGANGAGTLFSIDTTLVNPFSTLGSFPAGMGNPSGLVEASDGNLYITTPGTIGLSGTISGAIYKYPIKPAGGITVFDPSGNELVSGEGSVDFGTGLTPPPHPKVLVKTFKIENNTNNELVIYSASVDAGPFDIPPKGQPAKKLAPHKTTTLKLEMLPNFEPGFGLASPQVTTEYGEAEIISDDPDTPAFLIELTGVSGASSP
jgi:uncharacterized repeat protein (TIGR03803 family)